MSRIPNRPHPLGSQTLYTAIACKFMPYTYFSVINCKTCDSKYDITLWLTQSKDFLASHRVFNYSLFGVVRDNINFILKVFGQCGAFQNIHSLTFIIRQRKGVLIIYMGGAIFIFDPKWSKLVTNTHISQQHKNEGKNKNFLTAQRLYHWQCMCRARISYSAAIFIFQKFHATELYNIMGKDKITSIMC